METEKEYINTFNRIKLLDNITESIIYFAFQCGNTQIMDYVDMNCGALPKGDFHQAVDSDAPEAFLQMYIQTAKMRFAFSVTELLRMNPSYISALTDFIRRTGQEMQIPRLETSKDVYEVISSFYLDKMFPSDNKKIITMDENTLIFEQIEPSHKSAWDKATGDENIFYRLLESFIEGLLEQSSVTVKIEGNNRFTVTLNR